MNLDIKNFRVLLIFSFLTFSVVSQAFAPLKNNGNNSGSSCCGDNIIEVNGEGKVKVQPDIAILNIGVTVT